MRSRLLLLTLFLAALMLAMAGWAVDAIRWLVRPARRLRGREELPQSRLAS
jgi:hypothetical protein